MAFKLKEIVYDIREKLKVLMSDDTNITDEYLIHLVNVKRAFLLKQKYSDVRRYIPDSVKQLICIDLAPTSKIEDFACAGKVLRSTITIPELINFNGIIGITKVSSLDFTSVPFNYISMGRFP